MSVPVSIKMRRAMSQATTSPVSKTRSFQDSLERSSTSLRVIWDEDSVRELFQAVILRLQAQARQSSTS